MFIVWVKCGKWLNKVSVTNGSWFKIILGGQVVFQIENIEANIKVDKY